MSRLRREGIILIESVLSWRRALVASDPLGMSLVAAAEGASSAAAAAVFSPYVWRGRDYLAKMLHDTDFVAELPNAVRSARLRRCWPSVAVCCAAGRVRAPSN